MGDNIGYGPIQLRTSRSKAHQDYEVELKRFTYVFRIACSIFISSYCLWFFSAAITVGDCERLSGIMMPPEVQNST